MGRFSGVEGGPLEAAGAIIEGFILGTAPPPPMSGFVLELISDPWSSVVPRPVIIAVRAEVGADSML